MSGGTRCPSVTDQGIRVAAGAEDRPKPGGVELGLPPVVTELGRPFCGALSAHAAAAFLDVAKVRARHTELRGECIQRKLLAQSNRLQQPTRNSSTSVRAPRKPATP